MSDQSFLYLNILCKGNHRYLIKIHLNECGTEMKKAGEGPVVYLSVIGHGLFLDVKCYELVFV